MAAKQIIYSEEARKKLKTGVDKLARAVVTTLGPRGKNVAIDKKWGAPTVLHDGVSVAKEIELEDPFENMGAQLVKEASEKTNDAAGDGTTTATLLAQQIVDGGMKAVAAGSNPMFMKRGIDKAVDAVTQELKKQSKTIKESDWENVATVSAQNSQIGQTIAAAIKKVGKNGLVEVEDGRGLEIEIEVKEGMSFDKGYASPYFVTDSTNMEAVSEDPYILITDKKITAISELLPFLESLYKVSKNLVIIADDIEGEALATLILNKLKGSFNLLAVKAPGFGDRRKELLDDLAVLTGATVISEDTGRKLDSATIEDCGRADRLVANKDETRIIGGRGQKSALKNRIAQLQTQISKTTSEFDREKLEERLAKLSGGVAVINVGAASETEMNELKERVKDAVGATKAAIEEGIVPGGGVALLKSAKVLSKLEAENEDEKVGIKIVRDALSQPLRWLAKNSGAEEGWVVKQVEESKDNNFGFNAITLEFGDMVNLGIIDPVKVTRAALQNAASVASMILTTEALVSEMPQKEEHDHQAGGNPGTMGM